MESIEFRDYTRPLAKWWWLLLASTLLAATSTYYYASGQPPKYRSSSTIMVGTALTELNPTGSELNLGNQLAYVYADIARRAPVRTATQEVLGLTQLPEYLVRQVPNTQLVEISVIDVDPARAQAVTQELVRQLILQTPGGRQDDTEQTFLDQQLMRLEESIIETEAAIEEQEQRLTELFSARQIADAREQIAALETKLSTLQANYAALLGSSSRGAANRVTIIEPASFPTTPVDDKLAMTVLAAAALGFVMAAGGAYLLEYLDDSFQSDDDVRRYLSLPTLGTIPHLKNGSSRSGGILTAAASPSPAKDAYGGLRLTLYASLSDLDLGVLLVSSPGAGDGKSVVASNLGVELAEAGQRVVLVDADLHRPSIHHHFRLSNRIGLTNALLKSTENVVSLAQPTQTPRLSVLTSGPIPPYSAQLLGSKRMQGILDTLREEADIVLLDAPPVTATVDASILCGRADGVILVIAAGRTQRKLAQDAIRLLSRIKANVLGVVINDAHVKQSMYYSDYGLRIEPPRRWTYVKQPHPMSSSNGKGKARNASQPAVKHDGKAAVPVDS